MGNETASRADLLRRVGAAVGSGAMALLLVTGCAAGIQAQTVEQTPSIDGVQAEAGDISIRAAGLAAPESGASYAKGSSVPLRMVLVNKGAKADKLVSVTSPVAAGAEFGGSSGSSAASGSPSASGSVSVSASASGSPSATGSASASGSASATGSASASGQNTPIELPGRQSVQIGIADGGPTVTLTNVNAQIYPAQAVPVTLTFSSGASVTVMMAVQLPSEVPSAPVISEATRPAHEGESSHAEGNSESPSSSPSGESSSAGG